MDLIKTPATVGYSPPSTSVVHNAAVSLTERAPASIVHLVQYDTTTPIVAVELTANGQPYTVPGGAAVNVRMKKPDGHFVYDPALGLSDNSQTAYIGVTLQMTAAFGKSTPIIEIVVNGNVAATGTFMLDIDENQVPEDAYESTDEYLTIQQLAAEVTVAAKVVLDNIDQINNVSDNMEAIKAAPEEAKKAADSATLSESWAIGGTGTREGEDTNNAKYWSESVNPSQFATAEQGKTADTAVQSVNGKTGKAVTLSPSDVGSSPFSDVFPSVLAGGIGGATNEENDRVDFLLIDGNDARNSVNKPYVFGSEDPSNFINSPYTNGPFYGFRLVIISGHLITVLLIEQSPVSGRIWANTYDTNPSSWYGWKQIGAVSAMAVYDEMAAAYNEGVSGV